MKILLMVLALLCGAALAPAWARQAPLEAFSRLDGIAYRVDGARDEKGRYCLFEDPHHTFETPGLNCSGLVVELCRQSLGLPLPLAEMTAQGPQNRQAVEANGLDWDFGYRLLGNIAKARGIQGPQPYVLTKDGPEPLNGLYDALNSRGVSLDKPADVESLLRRLEPGVLYLLSFSDRAKLKGPLLHHHVAAMIVDPRQGLFLLHSTPGRGVHRVNFAPSRAASGISALFRQSRPFERCVFVLALPLSST